VKKIYTIKVEDYKKSFGERKNFSKEILNKIKKFNLNFSYIDKKELPKIYSLIFKKINDRKSKISGAQRLKDWERGWAENLQDLKKKKRISLLVPKWFNKLPLRWKKKFIKPNNSFFEFKFKEIFLTWIFMKYFKNVKNIYEYGCGTGTSLILMKRIFPSKNLKGLDWSSESGKIINFLNKKNKSNMSFQKFNFYKFDQKIKLPKNLGIFTVGALEQTGKNYKKFINFLIKNKIKICINVECMNELYNDKKYYSDKLAKIYHLKRGYLNNYLLYLKDLEKKSLIKIIKLQKQKLGSFYHEPYNFVIWRTLK